jgi:hypothetical protein
MKTPISLAITNASTLGQLEALVQAGAHPQSRIPNLLMAPLSATAIDLGQIAEACDRRFTSAGDRDLVAKKIGRALLVLTLTAQASGTPIAKCIEAYRATLRRAPEPTPSATQAAA